MNAINQKSYNTIYALKWLVSLAIAYFGLLALSEVYAATTPTNPLEGITVVAGKEKNVEGLTEWAVLTIGTTLLVFGVLYAFSSLLLSLVQNLKDSLRDKDWGNLFIYIIIAFVVAGFVVFIGYIGFTVLLKVKDFLA